jgi:O-methyltransferase involved in polyketide biosynthesis
MNRNYRSPAISEASLSTREHETLRRFSPALLDRTGWHRELELPNTPVVCEAVQDSRFFDRTFDGVLAWGLIFLLSPEDQRRLIQRIADILVPGGRLLFTTPAEATVWNDAMTGLESRSLGAEEYRRQLSAVGISLNGEYEDEGQNHYFDAFSQSPHALLAERDAVKQVWRHAVGRAILSRSSSLNSFKLTGCR